MTRDEQLERFQAGDYLFHGSPESIELFEPRQAFTYRDGAQMPDGEPAVFASPAFAYAAFMAVVNKKNCPDGYYAWADSSTQDRTTTMSYGMTPQTAKRLSERSAGYVYVFPKDTFVRHRPGEYASRVPVRPVAVLPVTYADLPEITVEERD